MKYITFTLLLLILSMASADAQKNDERKSNREKKQEQKKEEIKTLLGEKTFLFKPTHAIPLGGGSIFLNHSFDAEIKGDTIISYLPFFGVAYHAEYGGRNSGFDFTQPIENYKMKKDRDGYQVTLEVKNKMDYLTFNFQISALGFATLSVSSTNRQAITFYGHIDAPEK